MRMIFYICVPQFCVLQALFSLYVEPPQYHIVISKNHKPSLEAVYCGFHRSYFILLLHGRNTFCFWKQYFLYGNTGKHWRNMRPLKIFLETVMFPLLPKLFLLFKFVKSKTVLC